MRQTILAVDNSGKFLGYIPKEAGHTGVGRRHLAIAVLLFNSKNQALLQKRKHQIFDDIWDLTGATHPLRESHSCHPEECNDEGYRLYSSATPQNDKRCNFCNEDSIDETLEEATWRCLKEEFGISEKMPLKNLGFFNYFAQYGNYCENEHCCLMVGEYNGEVSLNPEAGYEYKWMDKDEFLKDLHLNPQNYTPWALEGAKVLADGL